MFLAYVAPSLWANLSRWFGRREFSGHQALHLQERQVVSKDSRQGGHRQSQGGEGRYRRDG